MKKRLVTAIVLIIACMICLTGCELFEETHFNDKEVTRENVVSLIDDLKINLGTKGLVEGTIPERTYVAEGNKQNVIMYELPDIDNYDPIVRGKSKNDVEVFLPLESGSDGVEQVVVKAAEYYDATHTDSSVTIRTLEASLAEDFIHSGTYMPDGYIASDVLYEYRLKENGISASEISGKLLGDTVGIVLKKDSYDILKSYYGEKDYEFIQIDYNKYYMRLVRGDINYDGIFKAVFDGKVRIGYLNPINNPTGLNFVVSMLSYFDSSNPLSMEATTDFSNFQNLAKVSYSMEQMKEALNRGNIDAITMDYQSFVSDKEMNDFVFIPFGVRQDHPLLAIGNLSEEKVEVLNEFAKIFSNGEINEYASSIGFNAIDEYSTTVKAGFYDGALNEILEFWKVDRSSKKKIAVYFVCDISGSMSSKNKLAKLKVSALDAMKYIEESNLVGLMCFNSKVYISVPIGEFNETQQKYFAGAVNSWSADGGTATNNAILMALKELDKAEKTYGDIVPMIILLSDGETCNGYSLSSVTKLIEAFDTPIYTIGYDANIKELEAIAKINNGIFINASTDDVGYILKNLFNAEM